jgi:hypothetical protein
MLLPDAAAAGEEEAEWSMVKIPAEGRPGKWALASGSDVRCLTIATDGTLYCYANPSGTNYTLYKSTDGGYSWAYTGGVQDTIVAIATAPDDASTVYYATTSNVYKSTDAGKSFTKLPSSPGGAGSDNVEITCLDIARLGSNNVIAAGIRDSDSCEFGGVYTLDENERIPRWTDTDTGNYDVCGIAFSPDYPADRQLLAVATDETDTFVMARIGDTGWGEIVSGARIQGVVAMSGAIVFPDDYDVQAEGCTLLVGIDTGNNNGDVYRVSTAWAGESPEVTDLNIGSRVNPSSVDVCSVAVSGDADAAKILAGSADSAQVYISTDGGDNWTRAKKELEGGSGTCVLMAPDFEGYGRAYAVTSGAESGFSLSQDGGIIWNQVSLIDTEISNIIDLAVSSEYRQDNPRFMITGNSDSGKRSLWRKLDDGTTWERVITDTVPGFDRINLVELSPQYGNGSQVVFLAGTSNGNPAIWKSTDNGQTFNYRRGPLEIDVWAIVDDDTLLAGGYDGSSGIIYVVTDGGWYYSDGTEVGSNPLYSMAISPDYERDETVLVGDSKGRAYYSDDNGTTFEALGQQLPLFSGIGEVSVAFDPGFGRNKTVYAASNARVTTGSDERIYRFIIDRSNTWESIDDTLTDDAVCNQLAVSADGILYATNSQSVDADSEAGGMERSLEPTYPLSQAFEAVIHGLDNGVTLKGLWICKNQLWSIDAASTSLMTYTDTLGTGVMLASPEDKARGIETSNVHLEWAGLAGATEYRWQLDYETDFTSVPDEFEGSTDSKLVCLPSLEPATTYYWRVRATQPVLSPWSEKRSFTTVLSESIIACILLSPEAGDNEVPLKPLFQWSAIAGADRYELVVSTDLSFSIPSIIKTGDYAIPATAWESDIRLDYDTTYYWKVRGLSADSYSTWSAVSAFTTEPRKDETQAKGESVPPELLEAKSTSPSPRQAETAPSEPLPAEAVADEVAVPETIKIEMPPLEIPPIQLAVPDWTIYSVLALLMTIVLLLVVLLVLVVTMRHF